jgi:RNA polymerase sigma factor (sigma-70 family)
MPLYKRTTPAAAAARPEALRRLIEQARAGSEEAISEILVRYAKFIQRIVRSIVPPGDAVRKHMDSADFEQEAFMRLANALTSAEVPLEDRPFRKFVRRLTANTTRSAIRRVTAKKRSVHREDVLDVVAFSLAANEPGPADTAECREDWDRLLSSVPRVYRVILQHTAMGWTAPEIAQQCTMCLRTVERILAQCWLQWKEMRWAGAK